MIGIMIQGTSSDVGKSFICTALCRSLARKGIKTAPFKSQNMSNNSYVTKEGAEIGRSQGIQAEAAATEASVMMSPILLKPKSDQTSEVILLGKSSERLSGREYREKYYETGLKTITEALAALEQDYEAVVIEGAGSPVEMNLSDRELVNMKVAELADVPVILVADIDRGGIFASIAGTLQLLTEDERKRVIGVIINKFRGDPTLFESGKQWIEEKLGVSVLAVLPYMSRHLIEAEDSLSRQTRYTSTGQKEKGVDIAVIDLPYFANDTDIEPFRCEEDVQVRFVGFHEELGCPDAVIVPGTQSTLDDLGALQASPLAKQLIRYAANGGTILGISSGYYLLGQLIEDEAGEAGVLGLGLLPMKTRLKDRNEITPEAASFAPDPLHVFDEAIGFSMNLGESTWKKPVPPLLSIQGKDEGAFMQEGRIVGSTIHHLFYHDGWRTWWLNRLRKQNQLQERPVEQMTQKRTKAYDEIADWLERELDVESLLSRMKAWKQTHD